MNSRHVDQRSRARESREGFSIVDPDPAALEGNAVAFQRGDVAGEALWRTAEQRGQHALLEGKLDDLRFMCGPMGAQDPVRETLRRGAKLLVVQLADRT